jgi:hypothetical protein
VLRRAVLEKDLYVHIWAIELADRALAWPGEAASRLEMAPLGQLRFDNVEYCVGDGPLVPFRAIINALAWRAGYEWPRGVRTTLGPDLAR